jgi:hypothetical protein
MISSTPLAPSRFMGFFSRSEVMNAFAVSSIPFGNGTPFVRILLAISWVAFWSPSTFLYNYLVKHHSLERLP